MTMMFLLVCGGATIWGGSNVLQKYLFKNRNAPVEVAVVAVMLGASLFSFAAQFIYFGMPNVSTGFWWPLMATAVLNVGIIFWQNKSLKIEDASIVEPIQGTTPIFAILTSWLMLREFPTPWGLLGILSVVLGVYVLNLEHMPQEIRSLGKPLSRLISSRGAQLAFLSAVLGSISLNFDKLVVVNSSPMMRASIVFLVVAGSVYAASWIRGCWQKMDKSCFWPLFGIGLLIGLSNILMDWGFLYGIVPYVGSLKRFQIIVTTLLAGIFLREGNMGFRITASVIMFAGIVLIKF